MENLILLVVFVVIYAVIFLPSFRRRREKQALVNALALGDEVVLTSGIHGFVTEVDEGVVWVEVSEGVELKVNKGAIETVVTADASGDED